MLKMKDQDSIETVAGEKSAVIFDNPYCRILTSTSHGEAEFVEVPSCNGGCIAVLKDFHTAGKPLRCESGTETISGASSS